MYCGDWEKAFFASLCTNAGSHSDMTCILWLYVCVYCKYANFDEIANCVRAQRCETAHGRIRNANGNIRSCNIAEKKRRRGFLFIKLTIIRCLCASWSWQQSSRAVGVVLRIPGGRMQAWSLLRSGTLTHSNEVQRERDCLLCSHPRAGQGRASGEEGSRARTRWGWREGRSVVAIVTVEWSRKTTCCEALWRDIPFL